MEVNNYQAYTSEDLATDNSFIDWCLGEDPASNLFWSQWVLEHPDKGIEVQEATKIVKAIHQAERGEVPMMLKNESWNHISQHIENVRPKERAKRKGALIYIISLSVAASIAVFLFATSGLFNSASHSDIPWVLHENLTNQTEAISLPDGSEIRLEPNSSIEYAIAKDRKTREVILNGTSYFDVKRDESRPFQIYANQTITLVLGTSFTIIADREYPNVEVEVESGEVAVYATTSNPSIRTDYSMEIAERIQISKPNSQLLLTNNQKASFNESKRNLTKSIIDTPQLISSPKDLTKYVFENESISQVFLKISEAYGIEIEYDTSQLKHCSISTEIGNEPLFQQLEMICLALDLQLKQNNGIIYIEGNGCSPK